jgi:hypothetical protein
MNCQYPIFSLCPNESTTQIDLLGGKSILVCDRCAKHSKISSEFFEDHDRKFIQQVQTWLENENRNY